jgi:hypothetical protein
MHLAMKKISILCAVSLLILSSCKKNLPEVGGTSAEKVANEWWVTTTVGGQTFGFQKISTYNTSDNNNDIWVDDLKHIYGFKVQATVNYSDLTFSSSPTASNVYYDAAHPANFPLTVKITSGKVIPNGGHSKTGNITDSIYLQAEFSDDPGTIYTLSGHARTRFAEDEY